MNKRLLHSVIDDLLCSVERYPEIAEPVERFIFDEGHGIRWGLVDVTTRTTGESELPNGAKCFDVTLEVLASDDLIQFAHAVANGVVPHMPLAG